MFKIAVSILKLAGGTGFEPVNDDFKDRCLRPDLANPQHVWRRRRESNPPKSDRQSVAITQMTTTAYLVRTDGIEPLGNHPT